MVGAGNKRFGGIEERVVCAEQMDSATPGESMGTKSNGEQNREGASGDLTR